VQDIAHVQRLKYEEGPHDANAAAAKPSVRRTAGVDQANCSPASTSRQTDSRLAGAFSGRRRSGRMATAPTTKVIAST
jgi:hypothetical protein